MTKKEILTILENEGWNKEGREVIYEDSIKERLPLTYEEIITISFERKDEDENEGRKKNRVVPSGYKIGTLSVLWATVKTFLRKRLWGHVCKSYV